jgi:hypothetical protein
MCTFLYQQGVYLFEGPDSHISHIELDVTFIGFELHNTY